MGSLLEKPPLLARTASGPELPLVRNASNDRSQPKADIAVRHKGRIAVVRCISHSLRSTSRSGPSDLLSSLLLDFGMKYVCAPSRFKSAICHDRAFSDQFKWIEIGCHLS
jgi:hypothetical protein